MKRTFYATLFILLVSGFCASAQSIYLYNETLTRNKGLSEGHRDEIPLTSTQMGVGRGVSTTTGAARREVTAPNFSEYTITKEFDAASTGLLTAAVVGMPGTGNLPRHNGIFEIRHYSHSPQTGEDVLILRIELKDVFVTGYSTAAADCIGGGCSVATESITLNYAAIRVTSEQDQSAPVFMYDILRASTRF